MQNISKQCLSSLPQRWVLEGHYVQWPKSSPPSELGRLRSACARQLWSILAHQQQIPPQSYGCWDLQQESAKDKKTYSMVITSQGPHILQYWNKITVRCPKRCKKIEVKSMLQTEIGASLMSPSIVWLQNLILSCRSHCNFKSPYVLQSLASPANDTEKWQSATTVRILKHQSRVVTYPMPRTDEQWSTRMNKWSFETFLHWNIGHQLRWSWFCWNSQLGHGAFEAARRFMYEIPISFLAAKDLHGKSIVTIT